MYIIITNPALFSHTKNFPFLGKFTKQPNLSATCTLARLISPSWTSKIVNVNDSVDLTIIEQYVRLRMSIGRNPFQCVEKSPIRTAQEQESITWQERPEHGEEE